MITVTVDASKMSATHELLVTRSVLRMREVLNSQIFLDCLRWEVGNSNSLEGELSAFKHSNAADIFILLKEGLNIVCVPYYSLRDVIGYGLPNDKITRLNTRYLNRYSTHNPVHLMYVGSNLLHEDGHDKGFDHDFWNTARRKNSICYILNRAYENAYSTIYKIEYPVIRATKPWWKFW